MSMRVVRGLAPDLQASRTTVPMGVQILPAVKTTKLVIEPVFLFETKKTNRHSERGEESITS